jgi:hypothetical protein
MGGVAPRPSSGIRLTRPSAYELPARLACETVRATHDGDWGEVCARELGRPVAIACSAAS